MEILLIRHGQTQTNVEGKMHTTNDEEGLSEEGKEQAEKVAEVCKEHGVDKVYSSPEKRALETADTVAHRLGFENHILEGLRERNWGEWEGWSFSEIKPILDAMTIDERYTFRPPGGETWEEMDRRLKKTVESIISGENRASAIVSHGGAIRALIPLLNGDPKDASFKYDPPNASITIFSSEGDNFEQKTLLDTSHLE